MKNQRYNYVTQYNLSYFYKFVHGVCIPKEARQLDG